MRLHKSNRILFLCSAILYENMRLSNWAAGCQVWKFLHTLGIVKSLQISLWAIVWSFYNPWYAENSIHEYTHRQFRLHFSGHTMWFEIRFEYYQPSMRLYKNKTTFFFEWKIHGAWSVVWKKVYWVGGLNHDNLTNVSRFCGFTITEWVSRMKVFNFKCLI